MLTNPILADRNERLPVWTRSFLRAGFKPAFVAYLFNMDVHDLQQITKEPS